MKWFARTGLLWLLRAYKYAVSPMFLPACRYVPTCSEYAMEAVDAYGAVRGSWMALRRVVRCHPLAKGGYDPVLAPAPVNHRCEASLESARNLQLNGIGSR